MPSTSSAAASSPPPPMDPRRPPPTDTPSLASLAVVAAPPRAPPLSSAFYKTRLCQKFCATGSCHYGNSCTFAHGTEDVRHPPPHWHDASSSAAGRTLQTSRGRICRRFFAGEVCPYGDGCSYLHVRRDGSPAPTLGGNAGVSGRPSWGSEERGPSHQSASPWSRDATTRRRDWENTGRRADEERFGFARGSAEQWKQQPPMLSEGNKEKSGRGIPSTYTDELFPGRTELESSQKTPKSFSHLAGIKKLNGIYADWID